MSGPGAQPDRPMPEFNPLRFPPCACARCRPGGAAPGNDADGDSPLLRWLRTRVTEENGLRSAHRRPAADGAYEGGDTAPAGRPDGCGPTGWDDR